MGKWSSVLRWASTPIRSPGTVGRTIKSVTVGAGVGYVGWEALINNKPVVQTVGDLAVGPEANAAIKDTVEGAASTTVEMVSGAKDAVKGVVQATDNVNTSWGGVGDFMRNLTGGNAGNMFGNLFTNIFSGNVSLMSMLGLVAAGLLIFGRFGWMGKIAGALLGMLLIGNNSKVVQQQQQQAARNDQKQDGADQKPQAQAQAQPQPEEISRPVIKR